MLEALGLALPLDEDARREVPGGQQLHLPVRALLPLRDEGGGAGAGGARRAHHIQHPRTADQSGGAALSRDRRLQPRGCRAHGATRWPACRMERAFVVHGAQGWDEPTPVGPFIVFDVRPGHITEQDARPGGLRAAALRAAAELAGGDARHNARALRAVLEGEDRGPHRDCLLLGAALALEVAGQARKPREGIERAAATIDSGAAARVLADPGVATPGAGMTRGFPASRWRPASRERVRAARAACSQAELLARAMDTPAPPRLRLQPGGFDLIAELKLRSPAVGQLQGPGRGCRRASVGYAHAGAAAVSVLTEPTRFDGSLDHLRAATRASAHRCACPPCARISWWIPTRSSRRALAGAGGVLAILRMLVASPSSRSWSNRRVRWSFSCCWKRSMSGTSRGCTALLAPTWRHGSPRGRQLTRPRDAAGGPGPARAARPPSANGRSAGSRERCRDGRGCPPDGRSRL